jgi:hypothetical protein
MKTNLKTSICLFVILSGIFLKGVETLAHEGEHQINQISSPNPRYELKLGLNEFSILNSAVVAGLNKYGGDAELKLKMTKEENEIFWMLTLANTRAVEVLGYYLAEKSADLIKSINFDNLDANGKIALNTIKSLTAKVEYAQNNPVWDLVKASGAVVEDSSKWFIAGEQGKLQITGSKLAELRASKGEAVIAHGYVKVQGQIEVIRFAEKKENTLELFVMSQCPFGKNAEVSLINYLQNRSGKNQPRLDVRYIFYTNEQNGKKTFASLHGEEEIMENLVQMVIRDKYPQFFHRYLLKRADDHCPWEKTAKAIGVKDDAIKAIRQTLATEREAYIQKEYNYVVETYGQVEASPTYIWEGERVADIRQVDAFKNMASASASAASCSN